MKDSVFMQLLLVSITTIPIILLLKLLSNKLNKRYAAKWKYWIWLLLAVRLLIPWSPTLPVQPIKIVIPEKEWVVGQPSYDYGEKNNFKLQIENEKNQITSKKESGQQEQLSTFLPAQNEALKQEVPSEQDISSEQELTVKQPVSKEIQIDFKTILHVAEIIWLAGMLGYLAYHVSGNLYSGKKLLRWARPANEALLEQVEEVLEQNTFPKRLRILVSNQVSGPMIVGIFKPKLYLEKKEYSNGELQFILQHELTHYRRKDLWYKVLLLIINAVHWFNPFVYTMRREAEGDLECSCDSVVMAKASKDARYIYANMILDTAAHRSTNRQMLTSNFYGGKEELKRRLSNILDVGKKKKGMFLFGALVLIAIVASGFIGFKMARDDVGQEILSEQESIQDLSAELISSQNDKEGSGLEGETDQTLEIESETEEHTTEFQWKESSKGIPEMGLSVYESGDVSKPGSLYVKLTNGEKEMIFECQELHYKIYQLSQTHILFSNWIEHGTGISKYEPHIINIQTMKEKDIAIESPIKFLDENLVQDIDKKQKGTQVKLGRDSYWVSAWKMEGVEEPFYELNYGNTIDYMVKNEQFVCKIGLDQGPFIHRGEIELTYIFENGKYVVDPQKVLLSINWQADTAARNSLLRYGELIAEHETLLLDGTEEEDRLTLHRVVNGEEAYNVLTVYLDSGISASYRLLSNNVTENDFGHIYTLPIVSDFYQSIIVQLSVPGSNYGSTDYYVLHVEVDEGKQSAKIVEDLAILDRNKESVKYGDHKETFMELPFHYVTHESIVPYYHEGLEKVSLKIIGFTDADTKNKMTCYVYWDGEDWQIYTE